MLAHRKYFNFRLGVDKIYLFFGDDMLKERDILFIIGFRTEVSLIAFTSMDSKLIAVDPYNIIFLPFLIGIAQAADKIKRRRPPAPGDQYSFHDFFSLIKIIPYTLFYQLDFILLGGFYGQDAHFGSKDILRRQIGSYFFPHISLIAKVDK